MEVNIGAFRRGAIVPSGYSNPTPNSININVTGLLEPVRFSCLYFDGAVRPIDPLVTHACFDYLIEEGFLTETPYPTNLIIGGTVMEGPYDGCLSSHAMLKHTIQTIPAKERQRWSLVGQHPVIDGSSTLADTLYLEILGRFPTPLDDIPYEDILAFREKNLQQLRDFQNSLTIFSRRLLDAKDASILEDAINDEIISKIESIEKEMSKSIGRKIMESASIGFAIPAAITAGALTCLGLGPLESAAIGNWLSISFAKCPVDTGVLAPDCHYLLNARQSGII